MCSRCVPHASLGLCDVVYGKWYLRAYVSSFIWPPELAHSKAIGRGDIGDRGAGSCCGGSSFLAESKMVIDTTDEEVASLTVCVLCAQFRLSSYVLRCRSKTCLQ